jgi:hypothetical protein
MPCVTHAGHGWCLRGEGAARYLLNPNRRSLQNYDGRVGADFRALNDMLNNSASKT